MKKAATLVVVFLLVSPLFSALLAEVQAGVGYIKLSPSWPITLSSPATFETWVEGGTGDAYEPHVLLVMTHECWTGLSDDVVLDDGSTKTIAKAAFTSVTDNSENVPPGYTASYAVVSLKDHLSYGLSVPLSATDTIYYYLSDAPFSEPLTGTPRMVTVDVPSSDIRVLVYVMGSSVDDPQPFDLDMRVPPTLAGFIVDRSIDQWPMFHHDLGHTGCSTSTAPNTNAVLWSYLTGFFVSSSSPAVANGRVFVGGIDGVVYALDASTGAFIWTYQTGGGILSSPAVADGKVFIGSDDCSIYALDASAGGYVWRYTTGSSVYSSPSVVGGRVYVGSLDGYVYALDASTGAYIWSYPTGSGVYSSPAVVGGRVYVGSYDGSVYALDASTGAYIWSYPTGSMVSSSPAVADGRVYVGSYDGYVYALDASTGAYIWSYPTGTILDSSPAVADGRVYVGSSDGNVYALDASTGAYIWSYQTGGWVISSPAVADGKVFIGSDDCSIYALDASMGTYIWSYTMSGGNINFVRSSPAVADGKVFVGSWNGRVYAFGSPTSYSVTFCQSGVGSDFTGTVLTVDGRGYTLGELPVSYLWDAKSVHTYSYASPLSVNGGEQYLWSSTNGLATDQSGSLTVTGSGTITGNYVTQYYLTVQTSPSSVDSPSGQGWYDAGFYASISTTQYVDIVSGSSRYRFNDWTTTDSSEIGDSGSLATTVLMDKPKTITANYVTQYSVSFTVVPAGAGSTTPSGTNVWEDAGPLSVSATANPGYSFSSWSSSTPSITFLVPGSSSTTATLGGSGTITANFAHRPGSYTVTFNENGLPSGTRWSVTFNSVRRYSTTSTITFDNVVTGTYQWSVETPLSGGTGTRYVASQSSGSMSVPDQTTQSIGFRTQYYLTMKTNFGTTSPSSNWFDSGAIITLYATAPSAAAGEQYVWVQWTGVGSGSYSGISNPANMAVTMLGPISESAEWDHQYLLTIKTNGVPSPYSTNVQLAGTNVGTASDASPFTKWFAAGTSTGAISVDSQVSGVSGVTYNFISWDNGIPVNPRPSLLMNAPRTLTANHQTQYQITFTESGLPPRGPGEWWYVTLDGQTEKAIGDVIRFQKPSGTYQYTVTQFYGMFGGNTVEYVPIPQSGAITVTTTTKSQQVKFHAHLDTTNWAGYMVTSSPVNPTGTVKAINGSWIVQRIDPTLTYSSSGQWIGIGGWGGFGDASDLIQTGTASKSVGTLVTYFAWYETLPWPPVVILGTVQPGDRMQAMIFLQNPTTNQWNITINDLTQNWHYSPPLVTYKSSMHTAEWIEERQTPAPLADFHTASFGSYYTSVSNTNYATVNGNTAQIGSQYYVAEITMWNDKGTKTLARPQPLSSDGTSFLMVWDRGS